MSLPEEGRSWRAGLTAKLLPPDWVYSRKVDTIAKSQTDIESRVRVLEAQRQPDPRPDGGDGRRIGAVAGGVSQWS